MNVCTGQGPVVKVAACTTAHTRKCCQNFSPKRHQTGRLSNGIPDALVLGWGRAIASQLRTHINTKQGRPQSVQNLRRTRSLFVILESALSQQVNQSRSMLTNKPKAFIDHLLCTHMHSTCTTSTLLLGVPKVRQVWRAKRGDTQRSAVGERGRDTQAGNCWLALWCWWREAISALRGRVETATG
jgi:hypothetical protein